jgi:hypothetical protein
MRDPDQTFYFDIPSSEEVNRLFKLFLEQTPMKPDFLFKTFEQIPDLTKPPVLSLALHGDPELEKGKHWLANTIVPLYFPNFQMKLEGETVILTAPDRDESTTKAIQKLNDRVAYGSVYDSLYGQKGGPILSKNHYSNRIYSIDCKSSELTLLSYIAKPIHQAVEKPWATAQSNPPPQPQMMCDSPPPSPPPAHGELPPEGPPQPNSWFERLRNLLNPSGRPQPLQLPSRGCPEALQMEPLLPKK